MLDKLKNVMKNTSKQSDKKIKPNSDAKSLKNSGSFGGYTQTQIKHYIKNAGNNESLSTAKVAQEALDALDSYREKEPTVKVAASSSFSEIIATIYSEGDAQGAIDKLKSYLNENRGEVDKRFWYMLMDTYQVIGNRQNFERAALAFAQSFGASPPSWHNQEAEEKRNVMAGKNILILEPTFKLEHTERFKEFFKAAKQEKFCRINVSQCKFEQSEVGALKLLYQLFTQLRKTKIMSILMGDNNLIQFCKSYINPNTANKSLKMQYIEEEEFFWLLYLEILQWKGKREEYEELAFEYAKKFEISPPGWENTGVMVYDKGQEEDIDERVQLDKVLSSNNINELLELIKQDFEQSNKSEIEFNHVERIDFASAGAISHFIQELWTDDKHKNKEVVFKHPNEMILILLEMVGVTEFVRIVPKHR